MGVVLVPSHGTTQIFDNGQFKVTYTDLINDVTDFLDQDGYEMEEVGLFNELTNIIKDNEERLCSECTRRQNKFEFFKLQHFRSGNSAHSYPFGYHKCKYDGDKAAG